MVASSSPVMTEPSLVSPDCCAIARAVTGWSPVIIATLMPAASASAMAFCTPGRNGSTRPINPTSSNAKSCCVAGQSGPPNEDFATASTRKPRAAMLRNRFAKGGVASFVEMAEIRYRLGSALGRHHVIVPVDRLPDMRHRQHIRITGVLVRESPVA